MSALKIGDKAPEFKLPNQDGIEISLKDFIGKKIILYFYPKDNTPGCTLESCDFSENYENFSAKNAVIIGVSPDDSLSHTKFISKFKLKHTLLADTEKEVLKMYGVWGIKKNYGKEYEGVIRSTFIIDEEGKINKIYYNIKAKDHAVKVLESLA